jgi:hypothetical protein
VWGGAGVCLHPRLMTAPHTRAPDAHAAPPPPTHTHHTTRRQPEGRARHGPQRRALCRGGLPRLAASAPAAVCGCDNGGRC